MIYLTYLATIIFFLLLNFFLLKRHNSISHLFKVFDLNSKNKKISLLGGTYLVCNFFLAYGFFLLGIISYEHFYKNNTSLLIFFMFILSFIDDKYKIKPILRLSFTIILLFIFLDESYLIKKVNFSFYNYSSLIIENNMLSMLFTIFCIVCFVNALNLFDGINLQVILYTMGCIIYLFFTEYSLFLLITLITLIFFSHLNYQNKSFLGDSGVYFLAIVISLSVINLHNRNLIFADQIIFLFLIPGFEIVRLFLERIYKKKNPLLGDNEHIHHLLKKKIKIGTAFIVVIFSFFPIGLYTMNFSSLFIFLLMLSMYLIIIFFLKNNENK
jgi:UDP-GlcNAc:undecaprenyl-phosphate GlcNAc-1-phosphate transferase